MVPPPGKSGDKGVDHAVSKLIKDFQPDVAVQLKDDGYGNQSVDQIRGDDAKAFGPYLDHYLERGHEPATATRLAKAEWAGEAAADAGVIKETINKRKEKVNQILFPSDAKETFELDLRMHMARIKSAATFLNEAKVRDLRRRTPTKKLLGGRYRHREELNDETKKRSFELFRTSLRDIEVVTYDELFRKVEVLAQIFNLTSGKQEVPSPPPNACGLP